MLFMTPPTFRTVRFAPLPDPRRSNDARDHLSDASSSSNDSNLRHTKRSSFPLESFHPGAAQEQKSSFFRPFFRKNASSGSSSPSSSVSLTPTSSIDPPHPKHHSRRFSTRTEKILTLGAINLFRNNSRSSDNYSDPNSWSTITRPQSAPSGRSHPFSSAGDNNNGHYSKPRTPSSAEGTSSAPFMGQNPLRKAKRMLNGRVYGAGKLSGDPFANIKSDAEPEFVEWGYGGMGSVRGQHAAGMGGTRWERLHSGDEDPSFDAGSGMGWVKKRREERERERMAKEQEKAENERQHGAATPKPLSSSSQNSADAIPSTPLSPADVLSEHDLRAVTIPAHFQRHHHHRSTSRTGTITAEGNSETNTSPTHNSRVVGDRASESSVSEESSSSEVPGDEDDEETDDSEPERRTALGAGVEKYTRHKDIGHDNAPALVAG